MIQSIPLENLLIDLHNPRQAPQASQRDALAAIALEQGIKLANLAEDIAEKGLNPSELPMVTEAADPGEFVVVEGNRRIAALKLLANAHLLGSLGLPKKVQELFRAVQEEFAGRIPTNVDCSVVSRQDANH